MKLMMRCLALLAFLALLVATPALAADPVPALAPAAADWVIPQFRFHTGQVMDLKVHYTTLGAPGGAPVLVLHGTAGTGAGMLGPLFGDVLFGPGQALDAATHFIILPDAIGAGQSGKPSDGLGPDFPHYDYADMVEAQYRLVTEHLGVRHLRLVLGNSMGGMETWVWGISHPAFMDALVPMASQPSPMAARNWMLRRMLIETIRSDPGYAGGRYTVQPGALRTVNVMFGLATNGGTQFLQAATATHAAADALVDKMLAGAAPADANDFIWQWEASADYDPTPGLTRIAAPVLAINSADDERNPPETGVTVAALSRVRGARLYLIPASAETHGHGTTGYARFWASELAGFLGGVPRRPGG